MIRILYQNACIANQTNGSSFSSFRLMQVAESELEIKNFTDPGLGWSSFHNPATRAFREFFAICSDEKVNPRNAGYRHYSSGFRVPFRTFSWEKCLSTTTAQLTSFSQMSNVPAGLPVSVNVASCTICQQLTFCLHLKHDCLRQCGQVILIPSGCSLMNPEEHYRSRKRGRMPLEQRGTEDLTVKS